MNKLIVYSYNGMVNTDERIISACIHAAVSHQNNVG